MSKPILKKAHLLLLTAVCLVAIIINSCKKDSRTEQQNTLSNPAIAQAKSWYENAYPVSNKQTSQATTTGADLSQLIKPDWQHTSSYKRGDQPVLEIPIDPSAKFAPSLKNNGTGSIVYSKDNSRSSFLLLQDGQQYNAYIMTVIADPAYLKNDLTKLDHNKYNKRDTDFSGVVLYSTPKGTFVSGWFYKNGKIIHSLQPNNTAKSSDQTVQSLHPELAQVNCTDWYQYSEVDGTVVDVKYLGPTCDYSGGGGDNSGNGGAPSGSGGGGSAGSTPSKPTPPPCTGTNSSTLKVQSTDGNLVVYKNVVQPPPGDGDGTFPPPTTPPPPPPPPASTPCTVTIPAPTILDSLTSKYPCTKALIAALPNLNTNIARLLYQAFDSKNSTDITFLAGDPADFTGTDSKEDGHTIGYKIYINPFVLSNSSNEYRLVTLYHEALHAFLNLEMEQLKEAGFAAKYPEIKVTSHSNLSGNIKNIFDYTFDEGTTVSVVDKDPQHRTMAEYFTDNLRDAILAYNPSFPVDRATALARCGIFNDTSIIAANNAERDVTTGNSVGHKCTP
ncbi:hypothetical protein SAMN05421821_102470 [Mucilaginibacter lappiensis]|uniref:SprT-like family protein n=1 Tax=Mucilaginibacter lappiensis TaxID=354630 RepID=A0ABR6PEU4_9SPHI|nr:hypothetical protein [Mucilaginibacter lappiensis]MBB6108293.1 hypothetical protein [Mucilaginibacter lappiensis]SIQ43724.1 hypothetical protein SAMN05421821_102470 [Mucilaginibacter lappiensis]